MASNLNDMNMQVSDSVSLLNKNVREGGQSVSSLAMDLGTLKDMSKTGAQSLPSSLAGYASANETLMNAGGNGPAASYGGMVAAAMFQDDPILTAGGNTQGVNMVNNVMGAPAGTALMRTRGGVNIPSGINTPMGIKTYLAATGQADQGASNVYKSFAQQAWTESGQPKKVTDQTSPGFAKYIQAVARFRTLISTFAPSDPIINNEAMAADLFDKYVYGGKDPGAEARDTIKKQTEQKTMVTMPSAASQFFRGLGADLSSGGSDNAERLAGASHRIEALDTLAKSTPGGMDSIDILNEKGDPIKINMDDNNFAQKLSSGDYKVRMRGQSGGGQSLADIASHGGQMTGGDTTNVTGQLTVTVDQSGGIHVSPNPVPLSGTKIAANSGYGGAGVNKPGPH
jgi:hypothetical protein